MKWSSWVPGLLAALAACSAGDGSVLGSNGRSGSRPGIGPVAGTAAEPGQGDTDFGNTNNPLPVDTSGSGNGMGAAGGGGGAACTEGFCAPAGPDGDCGTFIVNTDVEVIQTPGNVLVIFDESVSMAEPWPATGSDKLTAAQNALTSALMPLQDLLTAAALFFPTTSCLRGPGAGPGGALGGLLGMGGPAVAPLDSAPQIPFQPGPQFLQAWQQHWMNQAAVNLAVGTPVNEAFDQAYVALNNAMMAGTLTGSTIVLLFTDGAPTCFPNGNSGLATAPETTRAAEWLSMHGIKTYVVGLPGADGVQLLNDIAVSGGTTSYILPENSADLEARLREAVSETVKMGLDSCTINLSPPPPAPEKLNLVVFESADPSMKFGVDKDLSADPAWGPGAGWTLSADATTVTLNGKLCEEAMGGRFQKVTFEYGCTDPPPLPPPPIVM